MDIQDNISQIEKTYQMIEEIKQFPNLRESVQSASHNESRKSQETKTHQISVTAIIRNNEGKYLICRRSPNEKAFPNKWCVPGGKIKTTDFHHLPKTTRDHWTDIIEFVLKKEVREETSLEIKNIGYVSNLAMIHPNGNSTFIISMHADHDSGKISLQQEELTDHAWVTLHEAKGFDLIDNIWEQIEKVDKKLRQNSYKE